MSPLFESFLAFVAVVITVGIFGIQFWLRRIADEMRKSNELKLRFKKMELEAARNSRGHE